MVIEVVAAAEEPTSNVDAAELTSLRGAGRRKLEPLVAVLSADELDGGCNVASYFAFEVASSKQAWAAAISLRIRAAICASGPDKREDICEVRAPWAATMVCASDSSGGSPNNS